jgi:hypothetical protein
MNNLSASEVFEQGFMDIFHPMIGFGIAFSMGLGMLAMRQKPVTGASWGVSVFMGLVASLFALESLELLPNDIKTPFMYDAGAFVSSGTISMTSYMVATRPKI